MSKVLLKKIGTEYVLNIPADLIDSVGVKEGDVLDLHVNSEQKLELEKVNIDQQAQALEIHEQLMDQYDSAFRRLAQ